MEREQVWRTGEAIAVDHVVRLGWRIVERNWRCSIGEVDVIAVTPGPYPVLVFCEVKCRTGTGFGDPLEAVTAAKVAKLRQLALTWLGEQPHRFSRFRIDAIGVVLRRARPPVVSHVEGIGS